MLDIYNLMLNKFDIGRCGTYSMLSFFNIGSHYEFKK